MLTSILRGVQVRVEQARYHSRMSVDSLWSETGGSAHAIDAVTLGALSLWVDSGSGSKPE